MAAFLDDGTIYSQYGKQITSTSNALSHASSPSAYCPLAPWRIPGSVAGCIVERSASRNEANVTFYLRDVSVFSLVVKGDSLHSVNDLLMEVRVHPHGAVKLLI